MLNNSYIAAAYPLAELLDSSNFALQPLGGSPLHHLVSATGAIDSAVHSDNEGGVFVDAWEVERLSKAIVEPFEKSRHDYVMSDLLQQAIPAVQGVISRIRNQVTPNIKELVDLVTTRMAAVKPSELAMMQIVTSDEASVLFNESLAKMIDRYSNQPPVEPSMNTALPRLSESEIIPLLNTGIDSLDKEVAMWVSSLGPYTISTIWEIFFCQLTSRPSEEKANQPSVVGNNRGFSAEIQNWKAATLFVFLWSRHMLENDVVLEGTEMALPAMRATLKAYMEQAGRLLNRMMEVNAASIKNGILVTSIAGTNINVNTPLYNSWLANGGDNDVLFGMVVSGKQSFTVTQIDQNRDFYRQKWATHVALISATDSNRRFNYLREQLVLCYESMLSNEEVEGVKLTAHEIHDTMKCFKAQLDTLAIDDTKDVHQLCMKLICRTRYSAIPAESFLSRMDEVSKQSPTMTPREAGTVATIEYVCDWVASQLVVSNV